MEGTVEGALMNTEDIVTEFMYGTRGRAEKNGKPKTFTAVDLMASELPEARWAVPGIVPEGVTLFAGKPKLGKSWASLGMCMAVATGGVALGKVPVERGKALYMALEDNRRRLQKRLGKLLAGDSAPEGLHSVMSIPLLPRAAEMWLLNILTLMVRNGTP